MDVMEHKLTTNTKIDISNTPAERILEAIRIMNSSGYQVQKDLSLSPGAVSNWRRGICQPSDKNIEMFCERYHFSKNWILTGIGSMKSTRKSYNSSVQDQLKELRQRVESLEQEIMKRKTPRSISGG